MTILTDCLQGNEVQEQVAAVYKRHFDNTPYDKQEKMDLAVTMLQIAKAKNDPAYFHDTAVSQLVVRLNIRDQDPVVRATDFCTKFSGEITMRQLAMMVLTDCLQGNEAHEQAAAVYRSHFDSLPDTKWRSEPLAVAMLQIAEAKNDPAYDAAVSRLLLLLNIL
jgi:hypothetical protein